MPLFGTPKPHRDRQFFTHSAQQTQLNNSTGPGSTLTTTILDSTLLAEIYPPKSPISHDLTLSVTCYFKDFRSFLI